MTTFFHESGHLYLELMGDLAGRSDAPQALRDDYRTVLDFLGAPERAAVGVAEHERFARALEAYLYEGRAPSPGLVGVFRQIAEWFRGVYQSLSQLDAALTPEVRAVFDRLFKEPDDEALIPATGVRGVAGPGPAIDRGLRPGDGAPARGAGGRGSSGTSSAPPPAGRGGFDPFGDETVKPLRDELARDREEIAALAAQGRLSLAEADAALADAEGEPVRLARLDALRSAMACLQYGARA